MAEGKRSLKELLESKPDSHSEEEGETDIEDAEMQDVPVEHSKDTCIECGDQPKELMCLQCEEEFCQVCFDYLHRTGKRKDHNVEYMVPITEVLKKEHALPDSETEKMSVVPDESSAASAEEPQMGTENNGVSSSLDRIKRNAGFIPMRLSMQERKLFRLLEAALEVSEYTDRVDIYTYSSKAKRIVKELREICRVLTGLVVANGVDIGRDLLADGDFAAHAEWFQSVFEIGRRYKIMNPERMRSNYGKMAYMIMDSRLPEVKQILDFDLYKPVLTVAQHLEQNGALELLNEPLILVATMEISASGKNRKQIQMEIKRKEHAIEQLTNKYGEQVRASIYSLGDFYGYIAANQVPVDTMITLLKTNFEADKPQSDFYSLGISSGKNGARLTHNHRRQYQYVLQSLTLWSEIMGDMYLLWKFADDDLLSETHRYRLEDTGQGLNRVKPSPKVNRTMHSIISRAQQKTGSWVGSSVVHLGDRAVPNALFFLDKYLQVPRILNPVNTVIRLLPEVLGADIYANEWAETQFGSLEVLIKTILTDFFRYAFDGSGADNFYDAGSCIDGRLTSAWNWANMLPRKPYHKYFLITGFVGFNGTEGF